MIHNKRNSPKPRPQRKKLLAVGAVAAIVLVFAGFLLSLSGGSKSSEAAAPAATAAEEQNQAVSGELQLPASKRYDYANLLTDEQPAEEITPVQPETEVEDDPFADMQDLDQSWPEDIYPADSSSTAAAVQPQVVQTPRQAIMYCDSFTSTQDAESQKALIAFQGIVATVVPQGQTYSLRIGPFPNREAGRQIFSILSDKGLVRQCALSDY